MRVQFKQAVHLDGKDYPRGIHEVPEKALQSKFFHKLIKAGLVLDAEAAQVVAPVSEHQRQLKLAEKLAKAKPAAPSAPQAPLGAADDAPPAETEGGGDVSPSDPPGPDDLEEDEKTKAEAEEYAKLEAEEAAEKIRAEGEKAKAEFAKKKKRA